MNSLPDDPGYQPSDSPAPDHRVERSRIRPARRRASERELIRKRLLIEAEIARANPTWAPRKVRQEADRQLKEMSRSNPRVLAALDELQPTMSVPPVEKILRDAELAAVVAQPAMSELLTRMSRTPGHRGKCTDLSGAAAAQMLMAASPGASHANAAFDRLSNGSIGKRWALGWPQLPTSVKTLYTQLYTITGRHQRGFPGHPIRLWSEAHFELLREIRDLKSPDGRPAHPRFGEVGIVDATRLCGPVEQHGRNTQEYLATLRRADMEMISFRTYERDGQYDTVIGWILAGIADQSTGVTLVSTVREASAYEPDVLFDDLLRELFRQWPACPLHTLVADSTYDTEATCRTLVEDYSIQPIITRLTPRERTIPTRDGRRIKVIDGRPRCRCGRMRFHRREGFYLAEHRLRDGIARGEKMDNSKARTRWRCPSGLCPEVSLYFDQDPPGHTWWPRAPDSNPGAVRRALELYRNDIESTFANVKHHGIGTRDQRCLWARDSGVQRLTRLHLSWQAARRLVHETGSYDFFAAEHRRLRLDGTGDIPTQTEIAKEFEARQNRHRWRWPPPSRSSDS